MICMSSKYKFSPDDGDDSKFKNLFANKSRTVIAAVLVIVAVSVFSIGSSVITGYVTYSDNLKNENKICEDKLSVCNSVLNSCNLDITDKSTQLITCQDNSKQLNDKVAETQASLDNCTIQSSNMTTVYKDLIKSSVKPICCSYADMQNGVTRNWNIIDNVITCTGDYAVNCSSGETNY